MTSRRSLIGYLTVVLSSDEFDDLFGTSKVPDKEARESKTNSGSPSMVKPMESDSIDPVQFRSLPNTRKTTRKETGSELQREEYLFIRTIYRTPCITLNLSYQIE